MNICQWESCVQSGYWVCSHLIKNYNVSKIQRVVCNCFNATNWSFCINIWQWMKLHPGFELWVPIPLPMMITVMLSLPPWNINFYSCMPWAGWSNNHDTFWQIEETSISQLDFECFVMFVSQSKKNLNILKSISNHMKTVACKETTGKLYPEQIEYKCSIILNETIYKLQNLV